MTESAEGFVLREIRYGDTDSIVKIYTRDKGLRSFIAKGIRPSVKTNRPGRSRSTAKVSLFPLLEIEFSYIERRESQTLYTLRQFRPCGPARALYGDVSKVCMLTFVSELLSKCLPEGQADEALYGYIGYFLARLDEAEKPYGHYHIWFLLMLSRFLGCYPQVAGALYDAPGLLFDLQEGKFERQGGRGESGLENGENGTATTAASALYRLLCAPEQAEASLRSMRNTERQGVLHLLLQYYTVQFSLPEIKSYAVLKEVFQA